MASTKGLLGVVKLKITYLGAVNPKKGFTPPR